MNYKIISDQVELNNVLKHNFAVLLYFSKSTCSVGESLAPKIIDLIDKKYPNITCFFIDLDLIPSVIDKYNIQSEPTVIIFFDQKETIRKSRVFSLNELSNKINRIYSIAFNNNIK